MVHVLYVIEKIYGRERLVS